MSTATDITTNPWEKYLFEDSLDKLDEANELNDIADNIANIYIWILCAVGIPGNILTIFTILTMQTIIRVDRFIALLALCDGSALVCKLIGHQLVQHGIVFCQIGCQLLEFLTMYLSTGANWVLVLICFERFISVVYPLKKTSLLTKRRSYGASFVIMGTLMAFFAIIVFLMRTSDVTGKNCTTKKDYVNFYITWFYWIQASLYLFIPFLCIAILTGCIVKSFYNARCRRSLVLENTGSGTGNPVSGTGNPGNVGNNQPLIGETERWEKKLTTIVVVAAIVFLVLGIPPCVFFLYPYENSDYDIVVAAKRALFGQIQYLCADATHAINFFLYFCTAKRFRDHLLNMVTRKRSITTISHNVHTDSSLV